MQFLMESSLLTAVGGVLGLLLAAFISWIIRITTPVPMTITPGYVLLAAVSFRRHWNGSRHLSRNEGIAT